jgi:hypothetical protein
MSVVLVVASSAFDEEVSQSSCPALCSLVSGMHVFTTADKEDVDGRDV